MVMARGPRRQAFASTDANASIASQRSRIVVSRTPSHTREVLRDGSDGPNPDAHDGAGHPVGQRPDEADLSDPTWTANTSTESSTRRPNQKPSTRRPPPHKLTPGNLTLRRIYSANGTRPARSLDAPCRR